MKNKNAKRPPQVTFEVNPEFINELKEIKRLTKISQSQFIRDAVWEKIVSTKQSHPAFQSVIGSTAKMPNQL